MIILLLKNSVTFHDFPWPQSFSMTFQAWKIPFLNSMTFHDACEPCIVPSLYLIFHLSAAYFVTTTYFTDSSQKETKCYTHISSVTCKHTFSRLLDQNRHESNHCPGVKLRLGSHHKQEYGKWWMNGTCRV